MRIRWYRLAVLVLWLAATGWLVVRKILPPLLVGEPPVYVLMADKPRPTVGWHVNFQNNRLGLALSAISRQSTDVTEIHSLVQFDKLPLDKLLPEVLRPFVPGNNQLSAGAMQVESHMLINPLKQLQSFDSKLRRYKFSGQSLVAIEGNVEGDVLMLSFRYGDLPQEKLALSMPENKIRDSFSPETELRRLHLGQTWTIVTYSPFALPTNPLELLQHRAPTEVLLARVDEETELFWNGKREQVWRVVYRSDTSEGSDANKNIRDQLWVRERDGLVLRQEVRLLGNSLQFIRMSDEEVKKLRDQDEYKEFFSQPL